MVYRIYKTGTWNLCSKPTDGSGSEERLTTSNDGQLPTSFSPDGKLLAFFDDNPTTGLDVWLLPLEGERKPQPFLQTGWDEGTAQFSPNGHWLAYVSDQSGTSQVYVQPYPGPGRSWQISTDGGYHPQWNPKGRELFYRNGNRTMVVDVTTSPTFRVGKPRVLYEGPEGEVSRDGQRFLSLQAVGPEQPERQINVVLSWTEELKRLVPLGNSHGSSAIDD